MTTVSFDGAKECIDLHVLLTLQPRCESRADRDGRLEDVDRASGPVEENENCAYSRREIRLAVVAKLSVASMWGQSRW